MTMTANVGCLNRRGLRSLLVAMALAAAGCASDGDQASDLMPGGASGYRWVGQGEQGNFASAHSFCRQNARLQNFGSLGPGVEQRSVGSATYDLPDVTFTGVPSQSTYANRRSFDSCMRSQGWATAEPGAQPLPPTASPPKP